MTLSPQHHGAPSFGTLPPELQQEIFSYFDKDNKSLFAVIRVNKTCYHGCIGMLLRRSTQKRLAKISIPERRQHYANMISYWDLADRHCPSEYFDGLDFPMLKDLSFLDGSLSMVQLRRCMSAGLHTLQFLFCELDEAVLELAAKYCTQLRSLIIEAPTLNNITPDRFVALLQSFPALRRLELEYLDHRTMNRVFQWEGGSVAQLEELSWTHGGRSESDTNYAIRNQFLKRCTGLRKLYLDLGDALATDAIVLLSGHPLLEGLHIYGWLSDDHFQQRFISRNPCAHPFPSMKELSVCGKVSTIKPLLSCLSNILVSLDLQIDDNSDSILPTVSRLSNLVHLELVFNRHRKLSHTDLDYISQLSLLQKCHIYWHKLEPAQDGAPASSDCSWLTDGYFEGWISKLPLLQDLFLGLDSANITQASLQALADSCPSLSQCSLTWEHDLNTWTNLEAPLFPDLGFLFLGKIKHYEHQENQTTNDKDASRIAKVIRGLDPKLKFFYIGQYEPSKQLPHERALVAAFKSST